MRLSEMKALLARGEIQLTKSLGQNFLHDAHQLRRIVAAAELTKTDRVLEIGPGLGPLTELLVAAAGEVLALEKDARLVTVLGQRFKEKPAGLRLVQADALEYLRRERRDWTEWKLVANLPYSVASPILVELAQPGRGPKLIVATLQLEVAKRLMAKAGEADYGLLTLLLQLDYEAQNGFKIPAGCFFPQPAVDSACVCLRRRPQSLVAPEFREAFFRIVKRSFSQRRKMMLKLLKTGWPTADLESAFGAAGLPLAARAETATLAQFVRLTECLNDSTARAGATDAEIFDVVDENDEVIGQRPRGEVHRLGLRHRAVHVLVFNRQGQVFLQKRSMKKDRQPGLWDSSVSGHVDAGESYDTCAVRELREEIGLQLPSAPQRLFKLAATPETDQEHVWVYRCQAEGPFTLHPEEIERGDWFEPAELARRLEQRPEDFASTLRVLWPKVIGPPFGSFASSTP